MSGKPEFESSRTARERAALAVDGELTLQRCPDCGTLQYPFREVCRRCLSGDLDWQRVDRTGTVLATADVHASMHGYFRERAPWRICAVALDAGPHVLAHAGAGTIRCGDEVEVADERVSDGHCVLVARPKDGTSRTGEGR